VGRHPGLSPDRGRGRSFRHPEVHSDGAVSSPGCISKDVISKRRWNRSLGPPSGGEPHRFDGGNRRDARLHETCCREPNVGESKGVCPLGRSAGFMPRARRGGSEPWPFCGERWKGETRSGFPLQGDWFPRGPGAIPAPIGNHTNRDAHSFPPLLVFFFFPDTIGAILDVIFLSGYDGVI
jgi:hypothetical protein